MGAPNPEPATPPPAGTSEPAAGTSEPPVIDLDAVAAGLPATPPLPAGMRRGLVAALTSLLCLLTVAGSTGGAPAGLGRPLWTSTVSLNGFTLGTRTLYEATVDARTVIGLDLATGRPRWSVGVDPADLPDRTVDAGQGVAAVVTRRLAQQPMRPAYSVTFVRESTGAVLGQARGSFFGPGVDGSTLLMFADHGLGQADCWPYRLSCMDVVVWDVATATVRWRRSVPPGTVVLPSLSTDGRFDGLAEVADDGTVRLRDAGSGDVTGTVRISQAYSSDGQLVLTGDALVTAVRAEETILVEAYRRPGLERLWSQIVPAPIIPGAQAYRYRGGIQVYDCGAGHVCLHPDQATARIIETATGRYSDPLPYQVILGLDDGRFLVGQPSEDSAARIDDGRVVDQGGRVLATLGEVILVSWEDSRDGLMVAREGRAGTEFFAFGADGVPRSLGTVTGTTLTCHARGRYLSCSDIAGVLRTWRIPAAGPAAPARGRRVSTGP